MTSPSIYHLDTNIVIAYFNGNRIIAEKLKEHLAGISISTLVFGELLYGARFSQRKEQNLEKIYQLVSNLQIASFDRDAAEHYSHIRVSLRKKGRPTGEADILIAAVALAHNATLVTNNTKHFEHIDRLSLVNWLETGTQYS